MLWQGEHSTNITKQQLQYTQGAVRLTLGAVGGIIVAAVALAMGSSYLLTRRLKRIVGVMEHLAEMEVENIDLPDADRSLVVDFRRLESALGVVVERLREYKGYLPAALLRAPPLSIRSMDSVPFLL